jgi:hypothetical protein
MKILVQNCHNHLFLKTLSDWTDSPCDARNFPTSENALAYCAEHRIPSVQIILKFDYDQYDISVPITADCEQASASQNALRN